MDTTTNKFEYIHSEGHTEGKTHTEVRESKYDGVFYRARNVASGIHKILNGILLGWLASSQRIHLEGMTSRTSLRVRTDLM